MTALQLLAQPVHIPAIPSAVRGLYAAALKQLWERLWRRPVTRPIPGVGLMRLHPNNMVSFRLGIFGVWEPTISRYMRSRIRDGAVCIDIGANVGYYALLMSRAAPNGRVYAVEPSPEIVGELRENLRLNQTANVTVAPFGVSDREEVLGFQLFANNHGASAFTAEGGQSLHLKPLDAIVPPEDLARAEVIKIDVEGMEARVLADIFRLLPTLPWRLTICAELRIDDALRALLEQFREAGFSTLMLENSYSSFAYAKGHPHEPRPFSEVSSAQHDVALVRG
jgi:FkbM family methyltransferase